MDEVSAKPEINILDIPLFAGDIKMAADILIDACVDQSVKNACVSATGAHGLVHARRNPHFSQVLKSFFLNLPDGMPGVWVGKLKGAKKIKRCYGPDFFKHMMLVSADKDINHFFCGGGSGVAEELRHAVKRKFFNGKVVGEYCPPFLPVDQYDYKAIADLVNATGAHVVWIGLSTPKQEEFAKRLSLFSNVSFIVAVGAAFDFHTDRLRQAPSWMQRIGMVWFFRLIMEPRRLFKRYVEIVPLFVYFNLLETVSFVVNKSKKV